MLADIAPYVALAALAAVVVVGVLVYWLAKRQGELAEGQRAVLGRRDADDIVEYTLALDDRVENLREAVTVLTEEVERYRHDLDASLSNIAVVRFDAFPDSGGQQSAAIALLDGYRSGVVISIIASRESARLYVKYLDHGLPDRELAPEEEDAVRRAVPTALPRGELSRTPVSTFSRETRRLIDEARRAAAAAQAAVADEAGVTGGAEGPAGIDAGEGYGPDPDQLTLPRSAFAGPEAELGFTWVDERPGRGPEPSEAGEEPLEQEPEPPLATDGSPEQGAEPPETIAATAAEATVVSAPAPMPEADAGAMGRPADTPDRVVYTSAAAAEEPEWPTPDEARPREVTPEATTPGETTQGEWTEGVRVIPRSGRAAEQGETAPEAGYGATASDPGVEADDTPPQADEAEPAGSDEPAEPAGDASSELDDVHEPEDDERPGTGSDDASGSGADGDRPVPETGPNRGAPEAVGGGAPEAAPETDEARPAAIEGDEERRPTVEGDGETPADEPGDESAGEDGEQPREGGPQRRRVHEDWLGGDELDF